VSFYLLPNSIITKMAKLTTPLASLWLPKIVAVSRGSLVYPQDGHGKWKNELYHFTLQMLAFRRARLAVQASGGLDSGANPDIRAVKLLKVKLLKLDA